MPTFVLGTGDPRVPLLWLGRSLGNSHKLIYYEGDGLFCYKDVFACERGFRPFENWERGPMPEA